jgi:hypothetical protein
MAASGTGPPKQRLAEALRRVIALRRQVRDDAALAARWLALKHWQTGRLRATYPDLFAQPQYRAAGEFFLTELYGAKDFERRDQEALRVVPKLARMLPDRAVETMALAVELDELSEELDTRVARGVTLPIDEAVYAQAYREAGTRPERARQIEMVDQIGRSLERLARLPLLAGMIHMMRAPAEAAGFGHLHHFLQSGFDAFRAMGPAGVFLDTIRRRETLLMERLFAGAASPFSGLDVADAA